MKKFVFKSGANALNPSAYKIPGITDGPLLYLILLIVVEYNTLQLTI